MRRLRFRSSLNLALIAGCLMGLGGCTRHPEGGICLFSCPSDAAEPPAAATTPSESTLATPSAPISAPDSPVPTTSYSSSPPLPSGDADEACDFEKPFKIRSVKAYHPDGPAYSGKPPHLAVLFKDNGEDNDDDPGPHLPDKWAADYLGTETQLVVCQYDDDGYKSRKVGTCTYYGLSVRGDGKVDVRSARYIYRVFEAKTGKHLTTFTLNGSTSAQETCPKETWAPTDYYQVVKSKDLADKLRPFVERRRGR
jgi:hypothetical protein